MKVTSDSFFTIGKMHQREGLPCQDYAFSGVTRDGVSYAIVSDGCSSSPHSDIGSRLLVHWFRNLLNDYGNIFNEGASDLKRLTLDLFQEHFWSLMVKLPDPRCLDATLVAAIVNPESFVAKVLVMGDGAFAIRKKNGVVLGYKMEMTGANAPPYLSYLLNSQNRGNYTRSIKDLNAKLELKEYDSSTNTSKVKRTIDPIEALNIFGISFDFSIHDLELLAVMTDGIASFPGTVVPFNDFMNVKAPLGQFIARTALSNLKSFAKYGIEPYDDFSIAALQFKEKDDEQSQSKSGNEGECNP